jgi:RNA polymerase sigma-70 factor (ECF subfamily)
MKKKALNISRDPIVAEDLVQESFVRLIDKKQTLRMLEPNKLYFYVLQTIQNVTLNYIKKQKKTLEMIHTFADDNDYIDLISDNTLTLEEMYNLKEEYQHIEQTLAVLSDRDHQLLYNKYLLGLSDKENAAKLAIKEANVRSYLTRARRRAMRVLADKGEN